MARSIRTPRSSSPTATTSICFPAAPLHGCSGAKRSASTRFTVRPFSNRAGGSSSKAWPRTAPSRRSGLPTRLASHSASSGTPSTIHSTIPSIGRCSRRSAKHCWRASAAESRYLKPLCSLSVLQERRRKTKGAPVRAPFVFMRSAGLKTREPKSQRVVHFEFDRMRGHLEACDLGHLQLDIAIDEVVVEYAPVLEERAILVEILECLAKRTAHRRDRLEFFLRQVVEVLVHRRSGVELVLDAVEARHQHRGKAQIW